MKLFKLFESTPIRALLRLMRELQSKAEAEFLDINLDEMKLVITDREDIANEKTMFFQGPTVVTVSVTDIEFVIESKDWPTYRTARESVDKAIFKILQQFVMEHVSVTRLTADGLILAHKNQYFMYDRDRESSKLKDDDLILLQPDKNSSTHVILKIVKVIPTPNNRFRKFQFRVHLLDEEEFNISFNGTVKLLKVVT